MGVRGDIFVRLGQVAKRQGKEGGKSTKDQFYQEKGKLLKVGSAFSLLETNGFHFNFISPCLLPPPNAPRTPEG